MKKRMISVLMTIVMLVGMMPVTSNAANVPDEPELDTGDISVSGTNDFGTLLSDELTTYQADAAAEQDDYEAGYSVAGLTMNGTQAVVEYHSMETAVLTVALYSEDWMQLLASAHVTVSPDEDIAYVDFEGEIPEYYQASAYLMDTYDLSPLCAAYTTPLYTKAMQELLNSTVEDYDEDLVLNLDEDTTTNFAVYHEDTVVIEEQVGVNTLVSADDETATYVIANADESITSLVAGDIFVYPHGESDILIVRVANISMSGSTVTITGDPDLAMEDVFQAVKIEGNSGTSDIVVDDSTADEGITYLGEEVSDSGTYGWEGGATVTTSKKFKVDAKIKESTEGGGASASVTVSGTIKLQIEVSVKYYLSVKTQYLEFKVTPKADFSLEVQSKAELAKKLGYLAVSPCPGVYVGFEPVFKAEFTGKISANLTVFMVIGFKYDSDKGMQNISTAPKIDSEINVEGIFFLGIDFCPKLKIVSDNIASAEVNMLVGGEIYATESGYIYEVYEADAPSRHQCRECIAMDVSIIAELGGTLKFLNLDWLTVKINIGDGKWPLGKMYYSVDNDVFDFGSCPNQTYRVTIEVSDRDGNPVPALNVAVSALEYPVTTNENGVAVFYMPAGNLRVKVEKDGNSASAMKEIKSAQKIKLTLQDTGGGENGNSNLGGILGNINSGEIKDPSMPVSSGTCGNTVTWTLYSGGLLKISGSGKMKDYYPSSIPWGPHRTSITAVIIEAGVTSIADYAFYDCTSLTNISIPNSVTSIGEIAFANCASLISVSIPNSVTSIKNYAFSGCTSLTSVSIPDRITSIGQGAFANCTSLTNISIPNSVTSIGQEAFGGCTNLISVSIPDRITSIGPGAFASCTSLTSVTIPNSVTSIKARTFSNCTSLTSVTIPNSVTSIGLAAFSYCTSLTNVTIPNSVTSIDLEAFSYCTSLTSVSIPNSVTSIDSEAFSYCTNLTSVSIPNSVTSIEACTFSYCTSLTSITIPDSVTSIGSDAFSYCTSLTNVYYNGTEQQWREITIGIWNEDLLNAQIHFGATATAHTADETIDVPLTSEPTISDDPDALDNAVYPGQYGSESTENGVLKTASFTGLVPAQQYILLALKSITVENPLSADNLLYISQAEALADGTLSFRYLQDASVTVSYVMACGASNKNLLDAQITFPEMSGNGTLQAVSPTVVYGGKTLTEGTDYVITGDVDFTDAGNYICYIRGIYQYTGLVACPYIVNGVMASGTCGENLTWTLTADGMLTINGTGDMTNYDVGESPWYQHRTSIQSATLSNGVTSIGQAAFHGCNALTSVTIPDSVTTIGNIAFQDCTSLTKLFFLGNAPEIGTEPFPNFVTLQYPANASGWSTPTWNGYAAYSDINGLNPDANGVWYYYVNGLVQYDYTGLVEYDGNYFYVENGILNWEYTGLAYYAGTYFYVENGMLNWNYTGLSYYNGIYFYVENGMLNWDYTGLAILDNNFFYVENGMLNWNYTGLAYYAGTYFYIENGMLNWDYTGLSYYAGIYFYVENGMLNWDYTGLAILENNFFYIENGMLNWNYTGLAYYEGIYFYIENGMLNWSYYGLCNYAGVWFYIEGGMLTWNYNGTVTGPDGNVYEVVGSIVQAM